MVMAPTQTRERILVIEDEADILEALTWTLTREGFRVSGAKDGEEGLARARGDFPDLILLDLMLPKIDGLEICRRVKSDPNLRTIPVIIVTAKGEVDDVVKGLEAGADDYIAKPFANKELLARIKAVIRRGAWDDPGPAQTAERVVLEGVVIDAGRHQVLVEGDVVQLTATEFKLLHFLATHRGRVFTRDQLLQRVVGTNATIIDRNVDVHVGSIRKKLGSRRELIETVRGVGYRFSES